MRSVSAVAVLAGPIVLSGYVVGAVVATLGRRGQAEETPADWVLDVFVVLAVTTAAWRAIDAVSPGSNLSRIAYFSNQVLSAWQSVALWTGLAVIVGLCAPVFTRFRGSPGLAPAGALLAVHFPWFFFACGGAALTGFTAARSSRVAHATAIGALVPVAWLGWVLEWQPAWGLPAGPEATVWAMVLAMVLGTRWWSDRSRETAA